MNNEVMFSKASDEWGTPDDFYLSLHKEFRFNLDPCATKENAKCDLFYTKEENGLEMDWLDRHAFVNPPHSALRAWVAKCALAASRGALVVLLIPARTDTKAFHEHIWCERSHHPRTGVAVRFLKGRLKFGGVKNSAPFPSMVVIFYPPSL